MYGLLDSLRYLCIRHTKILVVSILAFTFASVQEVQADTILLSENYNDLNSGDPVPGSIERARLAGTQPERGWLMGRPGCAPRRDRRGRARARGGGKNGDDRVSAGSELATGSRTGEHRLPRSQDSSSRSRGSSGSQ